MCFKNCKHVLSYSLNNIGMKAFVFQIISNTNRVKIMCFLFKEQILTSARKLFILVITNCVILQQYNCQYNFKILSLD